MVVLLCQQILSLDGTIAINTVMCIHIAFKFSKSLVFMWLQRRTVTLMVKQPWRSMERSANEPVSSHLGLVLIPPLTPLSLSYSSSPSSCPQKHHRHHDKEDKGTSETKDVSKAHPLTVILILQVKGEDTSHTHVHVTSNLYSHTHTHTHTHTRNTHTLTHTHTTHTHLHTHTLTHTHLHTHTHTHTHTHHRPRFPPVDFQLPPKL